MIVLYAFAENRFPYDDDFESFLPIPVAGWFPVAKLNTLRDLSKEDFNYFRRFYGKDNLRLRFEV